MNPIITTLYLTLLVSSSIALGYLASDDINSLIRNIRLEEIVAPEECTNLTMRQSAYCLNDYVNTIFKYKSRKDHETPTLEELKENGGDCLNWAELYSKHIEDLGFETDVQIISIGNNTGHAFATISDETGYCILDQTSVKCFNLGEFINH